ncbi:MAG: hypothetical protein NUW00_02475 [Candidatus Kaiserbacteria bacterium]|nr:hypothetical protein [Candidatus Kaiserbacteria bacterium]
MNKIQRTADTKAGSHGRLEECLIPSSTIVPQSAEKMRRMIIMGKSIFIVFSITPDQPLWFGFIFTFGVQFY